MRVSPSFVVTMVQYVQLFSVYMQTWCEGAELGAPCVVCDDGVMDTCRARVSGVHAVKKESRR